MKSSPFSTVPCTRVQSGNYTTTTDTVAQEVAITLRLDDGPQCKLFACPLDLETLALGHAAMELLPPGKIPALHHVGDRHFEMTSQADQRPAPNQMLPHALCAADLILLMRKFIAAPGLWDNTGCFHRAAMFNTVHGDFVAWAEDIGRHNCADRLAGHCLTKGLHPAEQVLFLSCRVTASMMEKAARFGSRLIVSRSAVTDEAIAGALRSGATLIGFAREAEERLTVFTGALGNTVS